MKISNSKKMLAKIVSENGGWRDGAEWAAQDACGTLNSYQCKPVYSSGYTGFGHGGGYFHKICAAAKIKNWHQTILSRAEYFHLYPAPDADGWIDHDGLVVPVSPDSSVEVKYRNGRIGKQWAAKFYHWIHAGNSNQEDIIAYRLHKPEQAKSTAVGDDETNIAAKEELDAIELSESKEQGVFLNMSCNPSIEMLAYYYRNKLDYANRKQDEADKANVESNTALSELEKAIAAIGFAITPIGAVVQEHATPNWRNWVRGDEIKCKKTPPGAVKSIGLTGYVSKVYGDCVEVAFEHHIAVAFGCLIDECFEFVNRPAK